jgi:hypothetical protein
MTTSLRVLRRRLGKFISVFLLVVVVVYDLGGDAPSSRRPKPSSLYDSDINLVVIAFVMRDMVLVSFRVQRYFRVSSMGLMMMMK